MVGPGDAAIIQLKVTDLGSSADLDQPVSEMQVRILKSTPLRRLMDAYYSRFGLVASQVRFMVAGVRIAPDDTVEKFGLQHMDIIDVVNLVVP